MIGHYQGAATDIQWVRISRRAGCSPALVAAVWFAVLEASVVHPERRVDTFDADAYAAWAGVDPSLIAEVVDSMGDTGVICDGQLAVLVKSGRDRTAAERARRYRQRKAQSGAPAVTATVTRNSPTVTASVTDKGQSVTATVTKHPKTVTPSRTVTATVTPSSRTVTASVTKTAETVTASRSGKGGGLGGGMGSLSSSGLSFLLQAQAQRCAHDAPAHALGEQMLEKLKSVGAVRSAFQLAEAKARCQAWVEQGITMPVLTAAIDLATASRQAAGSTQPLNTAFIAAKFDNAVAALRPIELPDTAKPRAPVDPTLAERSAIVGHYSRMVELGQLTPEAAQQQQAAELAALAARYQEIPA